MQCRATLHPNQSPVAVAARMGLSPYPSRNKTMTGSRLLSSPRSAPHAHLALIDNSHRQSVAVAVQVGPRPIWCESTAATDTFAQLAQLSPNPRKAPMNTNATPLEIVVNLNQPSDLSATEWELIAQLAVDVARQVVQHTIDRLVQPIAQGVRQAVLDSLHVEHSMIVRDTDGQITGAIKVGTHAA